MNTRTLFLDSLLLASAAFPSGFSATAASVLRVDIRRATTAFLLLLLTPLLVAFLGSWSVRPELFFLRPPHAWVILLAIAAAPATLLLEWGLHNVVAFVRSGVYQRGIALHDFWQGPGPAVQLLWITLIALGEEIVFRRIWIEVLEQSFGFSALWALMASSIMYGVNHLYFGGSSVMAKTAAGLVYGGLYLLDDHSLWSPFLAHALQNSILLGIAAKRDV
jgi:CAAX protease family protein